MNLHPVFVHFPIALLTIYALMELIRWKKIAGQPYWFYVKALFVMIGGLGALAATYTGDMARQAIRDGSFTAAVPNYRQVLNLHENFAHLSVAIFGIIAASYLILWVDKELTSRFVLLRGVQPTKQSDTNNFLEGITKSWIWQILVKFANIIQKGPVIVILAILGLISITITGGLGGIMVYGPAADPFFGVIYHLLFPGT